MARRLQGEEEEIRADLQELETNHLSDDSDSQSLWRQVRQGCRVRVGGFLLSLERSSGGSSERRTFFLSLTSLTLFSITPPSLYTYGSVTVLFDTPLHGLVN